MVKAKASANNGWHSEYLVLIFENNNDKQKTGGKILCIIRYFTVFTTICIGDVYFPREFLVGIQQKDKKISKVQEEHLSFLYKYD